jgi:mannose-6-phosphate isomerase-like protein (cupin superfamily)
MLIKKKQRIRHENSPKCIAYEYPHGDKDMNIAWIEIDGRYPEDGEVVNEVVKELVFVVHGKGRIVIEGEEYKISEGDSLFIRPGQKYFFEGKLNLVMANHPAWYPEQHKIIK